ncbi:650_t:CDS:1, partial [Racocetra persica]
MLYELNCEYSAEIQARDYKTSYTVASYKTVIILLPLCLTRCDPVTEAILIGCLEVIEAKDTLSGIILLLILQAPCEAEAQCAALAKAGK